MKKIRIGTRASSLAQKQVLEVMPAIKSACPNLQIELVPIATSGDKIQDRNLAEIGGKGLFIKELEEELLRKKIDLAIHSAKDVPPIIHDQTEIAAFTQRRDVRDCFVSEKFNSIKELPLGAVIGTSSARRKAMLLRLRPDLKIVNFRGNVDTRLAKIKNGDVDGSILAVCGLERLGMSEKIKEIISVGDMLPSGGQGSLIIQTRKNDEETIALVQKINHKETAICLEAEREFLRELGASCTTPVGVYGYIENEMLNLKTMIIDYDGSEIFETKSAIKIDILNTKKIGAEAALETKLKAASLMKKICMNSTNNKLEYEATF